VTPETPLISVILPVYNEAAYVREMVEKFEQALGKIPARYEFILVTNGCRDDSPEVCQRIATENSSVRAINSERGGWGLAVRLGLGEARGTIICYTNLARTNPRDLTLLLLYAIAHPDVVIKTNRKIRDNWRRRLGSLIYNLECRALFDLSYWDINGTPKVFPRSFDKLMALTRDDDLIDAEFNAICRRENYTVLEVPVFSHRRHGGKSTTNYGSALRMYWGAFQMWRAMWKERKGSR
jgi:undecaprenyl-phosphate 4-deoxy-4-formamido-L-arabinose transferase